ncbi:MAG: mannose-1-phosphate guanylyltransferase/mannose-6-phosphate isomerase, partial [Gammaproteobacteria bacterium]|nr:mannose-1-phosphate guanylyltransferase/mannose-6-phosphate isomerase [Gammaproteobacteria bacterium]
MIIPVILSGGSGTRLWPLSRALRPKQLLSLVTDETMIQDTVSRLNGLSGLAAPIIVCNEEHRFMIAEQMRAIDVNPSAIILEPFGRNTAPAVAISAIKAEEIDADAVILVLPADHVIQNTAAFHEAVMTGYEAAIHNNLVTFGIIPNAPETGYGYIKAGKALSDKSLSIFTVEQFVEKPDKQTAESYLKQGGYYWNSGMFMFKASEYINELEKFNNEMLSVSKESLSKAKVDMDFIRLDKTSFEKCPGDSIDYAVMEKTQKAVVVPVDIGWNDIGSWSALWDIGKSDEQGNVKYGDVYTYDTNNSYIHSESRLITTVGLKDHIVVETADAVMVAHRDKAQDVKEIV